MNRSAVLRAVLIASLAAAAAWLVGCAANDPFDPSSTVNLRPFVRFFVGPVEPGQDLNPTSYFSRRFNWSGTDPDGRVVEFYVSVRSHSQVPAPWVATTRTDTTMTFVTDEDGRSEATFYLACRDDRGALSDTLVQYVPLRNFPPVVNFQSDFDPLVNMQREFATGGEAVADTLYWNWGACNFRLFAFDLDGAATMDDFCLYTLAEGDPEQVYDADDPLGDPNRDWIRQSFDAGDAEVREFEIYVKGALPGARTLRVVVKDEAAGEVEFTYTWEVRAPRGRVIYVFDDTSTAGRAFYRGFLDAEFGADSWDTYDFWFGFPDRGFVLLETLRQFDLVIWTGGGASPVLAAAAARGGVLQQYVQGGQAAAPGQLAMISLGVAGNSTRLPYPFIQEVLGISPTPAPPSVFSKVAGKQALGQFAHLPAVTVADSSATGLGLVPLTGTEILYKMEYCETCYGDPRRPRPPFDPVVMVRRPARSVSPFAAVLCGSLQLEICDPAQAAAALTALLRQELGVEP